MTDLLAARTQMAMSLGFHIVFAAIGIAMPVLLAAAEWQWLTKGDREGLNLAQRWSKGTAILFAVGAVSGTVLSFELGLLWPRFMERAGPLIGPLFALEGFAFFTEAIFLGIYLYGWSRIPPRVHFVAGLIVAASGIASAFFVDHRQCLDERSDRLGARRSTVHPDRHLGTLPASGGLA